MDGHKAIMARIGVGPSVAAELYQLSGYDVDLVERCSVASTGLDQCKARIINERFKRLEQQRS